MSGNNDGNRWISGRQRVLFVAVSDKKAFNCKSALVITHATRLTLVKGLLLLDCNASYFLFSLRDGLNREKRFYRCESGSAQ